MTDHDDGSLAHLLRRALQDEVEVISPAGDGLDRIRSRIGGQRPRQQLRQQLRHGLWIRTSVIALSAAVMAGFVAGTVIVTSGSQPHLDAAAPAATAPAPVRTGAPRQPPAAAHGPELMRSATAPTGTAAGAEPVPNGTRKPSRLAGTLPVTVYYLGETGGSGLRLYREQRNVPRGSGAASGTSSEAGPETGTEAGTETVAEVVRTAVETLAGRRPQDPDYRNEWPPAKPRGIDVRDGTLIIDLPASAAARTASADVVRLSVQQLVHTATEAAGRPAWGVRLRVEGRDVSTLWGQPIGTQPLRREAQPDVLAPVWVTSPGGGSTVSGTFTVRGEASVFEAAVNWRIRAVGDSSTRSTSDTREGHLTASAGAPQRGTWSATVSLPPGKYELRVFSLSARDGTEESADSKIIVVR